MRAGVVVALILLAAALAPAGAAGSGAQVLYSSEGRIIVSPGGFIADRIDPDVLHLAFIVQGLDADRIYYMSSGDGGATWSRPVLVSEYRHEGSPEDPYRPGDTQYHYTGLVLVQDYDGGLYLVYTYRGEPLHIEGWDGLPPEKFGFAYMTGNGSWVDVELIFDPYTPLGEQGLGETVVYVTSMDAISTDPRDVVVVYTDYSWYSTKYNVVAFGVRDGELSAYRVLHTIEPGEIDLYSAAGVSIVMPDVRGEGGRLLTIPFVNLYNATIHAVTLWENSRMVIGPVLAPEGAPTKEKPTDQVWAVTRGVDAGGEAAFATQISGPSGGVLAIYGTRDGANWEYTVDPVDPGLRLSSMGYHNGNYILYLTGGGEAYMATYTPEGDSTWTRIPASGEVLEAVAPEPRGDLVLLVTKTGSGYQLELVDTSSLEPLEPAGGEEARGGAPPQTTTTTAASTADTVEASQQGEAESTGGDAGVDTAGTATSSEIAEPSTTETGQEAGEPGGGGFCEGTVELPVLGSVEACTAILMGLLLLLIIVVAAKK